MLPVYFSRPAVFCAAGNNIDELWENVVSGSQKGICRVKALNGKEFFAARIADSLLKKSSGRYDMRIIRLEEQTVCQLEDKIEFVKNNFTKIGEIDDILIYK